VADSLSEIAAKVYLPYQTELRKNNALDFDDLIMKTVELFTQNPLVLKKYQELWQHILVDEYQDTNKAQYQLVSQLAQTHQNICVVGDDSQSIYSWRMADIRNILDFEKDYPKAQTILLEQNYRSTKTILDVSNAIIAKNKNQKEKKLWTENVTGEPIMIAEVEDEKAEAQFILEQIFQTGPASTAINKKQKSPEEITYDEEYAQVDPEEAAILEGESILDRVMGWKKQAQSQGEQSLAQKIFATKKHTDFSKYVVMYRTNAQSRAIEEVLLKFQIPYKIIGGMRFYERREIKDMIAYLQVIFNLSDWVALERIVNLPPRGIGDRTWFKIEQFAKQRDFSVLTAGQHDIPDIQNARLKSFYQFVAVLKHLHSQAAKLNPTQILELVLKETGYKEFLLNNSESREQGEARLENIAELKTVTEKYKNLRGEEGLQAFLEDVALVSDQDEVNENDNVIKLMTVHAAKGLEFPVVFVVGMEEGLFPHARSLINPAEMEEERRLFYVALTRAIEKVYLVLAQKRTRYGNIQVNPPSRFLEDIPAQLSQWEK